MNALIFAVIALWVVVLVLIGIVFALTRQVGILFERVTPVGAMVNDSGPQIGDPSPQFRLTSLNGGEIAIGGQRPRAMLVFFLSTSCPICKTLLPALKSIRQHEADWLDVVLASDGDEQRHRQFIQQAGLQRFPYLLSAELGMRYRVSKLPFAVLLNEHGDVENKGLVNSREQLESLFNARESGHVSLQQYLKLSQ